MNAKQNYKWNELTMGTCYYPEHWSRELWQDDLQRMKAAGITVIRVAEFAWNKVEPEEGVFTFDFWDEFMELLFFSYRQLSDCTMKLFYYLNSAELYLRQQWIIMTSQIQLEYEGQRQT